MIYVYALTDVSPELQLKGAVAGMDDQPIRWVCRSGIAAVYSRHAAGRFAPTRENLLRHEQVAETLMTREALLPARFATTFADEQELCGMLQRHAETLCGGLRRVRRCVELGLRVLWQPAEAPEAAANAVDATAADGGRFAARSGREYLLARLEQQRQRRQQQQQAEQLVEQIQGPLIPLARAHRQRVLHTPTLLLTAAYLVDRDQIEAFRGSARAVAARYPQQRLLCTGPWPPYHFAPRLPASEPASELRHV